MRDPQDRQPRLACCDAPLVQSGRRSGPGSTPSSGSPGRGHEAGSDRRGQGRRHQERQEAQPCWRRSGGSCPASATGFAGGARKNGRSGPAGCRGGRFGRRLCRRHRPRRWRRRGRGGYNQREVPEIRDDRQEGCRQPGGVSGQRLPGARRESLDRRTRDVGGAADDDRYVSACPAGDRGAGLVRYEDPVLVAGDGATWRRGVRSDRLYGELQRRGAGRQDQGARRREDLGLRRFFGCGQRDDRTVTVNRCGPAGTLCPAGLSGRRRKPAIRGRDDDAVVQGRSRQRGQTLREGHDQKPRAESREREPARPSTPGPGGPPPPAWRTPGTGRPGPTPCHALNALAGPHLTGTIRELVPLAFEVGGRRHQAIRSRPRSL